MARFPDFGGDVGFVARCLRHCVLGVALALCMICGSAFAGERLALLVGVSEYPGLGSRFNLEGPRNDAVLMRDVLTGHGFLPANIVTLTEEVPGADLPTRTNILEALDRLIARASTGDFVFLLFAGHGSQMPADPSTTEGKLESDGLHEIFLPRDVGKWRRNIGRVENAIVDHELASRLDALLAKGAFVWAVFDACHSATLMRGGPAVVRYRQVTPDHLGIPVSAMNKAAAGRLRTRGDAIAAEAPIAAVAKAGTDGRFVAFYAAQTTQETPEMPLPAAQPDSEPHGLFTYTIAEALSKFSGLTYRQVAQYTLQRYTAQNFSTPTPLFSGDALDQPLFLGTGNGTSINSARQWPLEHANGQRIAAGRLHGVSAGSVLALLPSPTASEAELIGYMRVESVGAVSSLLSPIAHLGRSAPEVAQLSGAAYVRMLADSDMVPLVMRVAGPDGGSVEERRRVTRGLAAISVKSGVVRLQAAKGTTATDLRLVIDRGQLWLAPPDGGLVRSGSGRTHSIGLASPGFERKLVDALQRIGKALNLLRIHAHLGTDMQARNLSVTVQLRRKDVGARTLDTVSVASAQDGDELEVTLHNRGSVSIDATLLYLDGGFEISALYPRAGASNRLEPDARESVTLVLNEKTIGIERLISIAVEARAGAERQDFSFLAQTRLEQARNAGPPGVNDVRALFESAGFGTAASGATRSAVEAPKRTEMHVLSLRVRRRG